jgi:hypothetical protein
MSEDKTMRTEKFMVKNGDAIKLIALNPEGKKIIENAGSDVWTILKIQGCVLSLDLNPGVYIAPDKQGKGAVWIALNDSRIELSPCPN